MNETITASVPYYYDLKGRVTKQVRTNLLGGADVTTGYADDKNSHLAKDLNKDQCFYFFNFILLLIVCKRFFFVNRFIYGLR